MEKRNINLNNINSMNLEDISTRQDLTKEIVNLDKTADGWRIREAKKTVLDLTDLGNMYELFVEEDNVYLHYVNNSNNHIIDLYRLSSDHSKIETKIEQYTFDFGFRMYNTNYNKTFFIYDTTYNRNLVLDFNDKLFVMVNDIGDLDTSTEFLCHIYNATIKDCEWSFLGRRLANETGAEASYQKIIGGSVYDFKTSVDNYLIHYNNKSVFPVLKYYDTFNKSKLFIITQYGDIKNTNDGVYRLDIHEYDYLQNKPELRKQKYTKALDIDVDGLLIDNENLAKYIAIEDKGIYKEKMTTNPDYKVVDILSQYYNSSNYAWGQIQAYSNMYKDNKYNYVYYYGKNIVSGLYSTLIINLDTKNYEFISGYAIIHITYIDNITYMIVYNGSEGMTYLYKDNITDNNKLAYISDYYSLYYNNIYKYNNYLIIFLYYIYKYDLSSGVITKIIAGTEYNYKTYIYNKYIYYNKMGIATLNIYNIDSGTTETITAPNGRLMITPKIIDNGSYKNNILLISTDYSPYRKIYLYNVITKTITDSGKSVIGSGSQYIEYVSTYNNNKIYVYRNNNTSPISWTVIAIDCETLDSTELFELDNINYNICPINNEIYLSNNNSTYSPRTERLLKYIDNEQTYYIPRNANIAKVVVNNDATITITNAYINKATQAILYLNYQFDKTNTEYLNYILTVEGNDINVYLVEKNVSSGFVGYDVSTETAKITITNVWKNSFNGVFKVYNLSPNSAGADISFIIGVLADNTLQLIELYIDISERVAPNWGVQKTSLDTAPYLLSRPLLNLRGEEYFPSNINSLKRITCDLKLNFNSYSKNYIYVEDNYRIVKIPITGLSVTQDDINNIEEIIVSEISQYADISGTILGLNSIKLNKYSLIEINLPQKVPIRPYFNQGIGNDTSYVIYSLLTATLLINQNWIYLNSTEANDNIFINSYVNITQTVGSSTITLYDKDVDKIQVIGYDTGKFIALSEPCLVNDNTNMAVTFYFDITVNTIAGSEEISISGVAESPLIKKGMYIKPITTESIEDSEILEVNEQTDKITISTEAKLTSSSVILRVYFVEYVEVKKGNKLIKMKNGTERFNNSGNNYYLEYGIESIAFPKNTVIAIGSVSGTNTYGAIYSTDIQILYLSKYLETTELKTDCTITFHNLYTDEGNYESITKMNTIYEMNNHLGVPFKTPFGERSEEYTKFLCMSDYTTIFDTMEEKIIHRNWILGLQQPSFYDMRFVDGGVDIITLAKQVNGEWYYYEQDINKGGTPYQFSLYQINYRNDNSISNNKVFYRIGDFNTDRFTGKAISLNKKKTIINSQDMVMTSYKILIVLDYKNKKLYWTKGLFYWNKMNEYGLKSNPVAIQELQNGNCILVCENDIYMTSGTDETSFIVQHISSGVGLEYDNWLSLVTSQNVVAFHNKNGIYIIKDGTMYKTVGMDDYLYKQISGNVLGIDKSKNEIYVRLNSTAIKDKLEYYLLYTAPIAPADELKDYGITEDKHIQYNQFFGVYNYDNNNWKIYAYYYADTTPTSIPSIMYYDTLDNRMIMQLGNQLIIPSVNFGEIGDNENPLARIITRRNYFGDPYAIKHLYNVLIHFVIQDIAGTEYGINYLKVVFYIDDKLVGAKEYYSEKYGYFKHTTSEYVTAGETNLDFVSDIEYNDTLNPDGIDSTTGISSIVLPTDIDFRKLRMRIEFGRLEDDTHKCRAVLNNIALEVFDKIRIGGIR